MKGLAPHAMTVHNQKYKGGFRLGFVVLVLSSVFCVTAATADSGTFIKTSDEDFLQIVREKGIRTNFAEIVDALDREGYEVVKVEQTLLNRVLIRARNSYHLREIVVSRASGQILRDRIIETFEQPQKPASSSLDHILKTTPGGIRLRDE
ncbi:hypothetical protein [Frigidibacter sp. ROC022]|uniref:hypothetical protein n=1 Tax=Frigidibacter sp. ROC022 TaxID=2971796 RepID=UPI00215AE81F|nr:hypothetical protein [Frigidibacter sp. ROC022]MCR8726659.1 hypothetical protein [Frigidibacter sp. ROC022]